MNNTISDSRRVFLKEKASCCMFYDYFLQPRITEEEEAREESAYVLQRFLKEMGLSFDEFYRMILDYSLGHGLDYIKDLYDSFKDSFVLEEEDDDGYIDF